MNKQTPGTIDPYASLAENERAERIRRAAPELLAALDRVERQLYANNPEGLPMEWRFVSAALSRATGKE